MQYFQQIFDADKLFLLSCISVYGIISVISLYLDMILLPVYALGFILLIVGFYKSIQTPYLILLLLVPSTYIGSLVELNRGGPIPFTLFQIFIIVGVIIFIIYYLNEGWVTLNAFDFTPYLLVFVALIFLSLIYTSNRFEGIFYTFRYLVLLFFAYLIINVIQEKREIYVVLTVVCIVSFTLAIYSASQNLLSDEVVIMNYVTQGKLFGRSTGAEIDPNMFASRFFLPLAFLLSVMHAKVKILYKILAIVVALGLLAGIMSTYSRSAWISIAVMGVIVIYYYKNYNYLFLGLGGLIITVVFVPEVRMVLYNLYDRLLEIFAGESDASSKIRILLGIGSIKMFMNSYFLGVGFRGFPVEFTDYFYRQETLGVIEPHNMIYTVFAELGILGLILMSVIVFKTLKTSYITIKVSKDKYTDILAVSLMTSFIAYLVFYQFYGGAYADNLLMANVGLIYATNIVSNEKYRAFSS